MKKNDIKAKLREGLEVLTLSEEHSNTEKAKQNNEHPQTNVKKRKTGGKKDYSDVKRSIEKIGGPSIVDVMKLTGIPDDEKAVNRSLFTKKVNQVKNKETGSYYQFNDQELNQVRAALDIQK